MFIINKRGKPLAPIKERIQVKPTSLTSYWIKLFCFLNIWGWTDYISCTYRASHSKCWLALYETYLFNSLCVQVYYVCELEVPVVSDLFACVPNEVSRSPYVSASVQVQITLHLNKPKLPTQKNYVNKN